MGKAVVFSDQKDEHIPLEVTLLEGDIFDGMWTIIATEMDEYPESWELWTKDHIRQAVLDNRMQCWAIGTRDAYHFVVFTQVGFYPAKKVLQVVFAFGRLIEGAMDLLAATFRKFAILQGCEKIDFVMGRPGWEKFCKRYGMRKTAVIMSYDVELKERMH